ncbi:serine/threonine-protein kinase [Streptomyces pinistramenti]|uniref:serine/threonine-protein kinase n=1 Tax=Streptomyces pinistramenti TaxID=2884812 RepID=UPI001D081050|nr:serine/threonine-protein kinase [Streptomyces pinistramenti]MCB5911176.1 protein kinase [Streptomyces pinistramenti]
MGSFGGEGRLIAGRYRLAQRLGRGGMGTVWRAADELLGRQVAVKELHLDDGVSDPEAQVQRDRAMREARTVAGIKHPNVVVVHDVVEQDGRPWIVMELVEGPSLADRLSAGGPVAPREAARIGVALLGALRTAHSRGVLHRDVKPANVLVESGTGRIVLTDFGIAQVPGVTTLTEAGGFVGSPEYTAPERMAGHGTGPEADLWSLGVLLCAALSGESPFRRDSLGGVLHAVVHDEIDIPEAARPLLAVVRGLLERDPAQRLDAAETDRLLRGYLHSGRAPERGHGHGHGHGLGVLWGHGPGTPGPGAAAAASASPPGGPGNPGGPHGGATSGRSSDDDDAPAPATSPGPAGTHPDAPAAGPGSHSPLHDGPYDSLPSGHPPSEETPSGRTPASARPLVGGPPFTPPPPGHAPPGSTPPDGEYATRRRALSRRSGGRTGRRAPGVPLPGTLADRALAAAARPHTGRTRTVLLVALAAVVLFGSVTGIVALLVNIDDAGHSPSAPGTRPASTPGGPPRPTVRAPDGYSIVSDPQGFALAVPEGFTRSYEKPRVSYCSAGRRFRLGIQARKQKADGPLGQLRTADAHGPAHYPGYRAGEVTETTHNGFPAALWEFVWDGGPKDGGPRHTYDLSWDEDGKMYDVSISAPVGQRAAAKRHFDTAIDTFQRLAPGGGSGRR